VGLPYDRDADSTITPTRVSRATAVYGVHAYHTKVPVEAISPFVRQNTSHGGLVLDPFCGSGMTGVAAALEGRRAVLNDLSPAAAHIARNYTTPCSASALGAAASRLMAWVEPQIAPAYEVSCPSCGGRAVTEYVVWSDVRRCPECRASIVVWDSRESGLKTLTCRTCGHAGRKTKAELLGERPVQVNVRCLDCRRRDAIDPRLEDVALANAASPPAFWYPDLPFGSDWDMWRGGHRDLAISRVADFWSSRNLAALSVFWEGIGRETDERMREALRFVFTAIANRASRRYQWNAKRPTNVLGGTLYVASQLPFSKQFSPAQVPSLGAFLTEVASAVGSRATVQDAVHRLLHPSASPDSEQYTMTYNALLSASHYGLVTTNLDALTPFGEALLTMADDEERLLVLARHILENLNGAELVSGLVQLNHSEMRLNKTQLAKFFIDRGLASNADGTDINALAAWLAGAGIFGGSGWYRVDEARFAEIAGFGREELEVYAGLSRSNAAIVEQLALQPGYASDSGEMQKLLAGRADVEIDAPAFVTRHLRPLEAAGLITVEKTTGGRGGSRTRFVGTGRFRDEVVQRLLARFREVGFAVSGPELQRPMSELVAEMTDAEASKDTRGRALELFALRLLHRLGLQNIKLRARPAGAEEIDGLAEGLSPVHTRWQVQCKNTATLTVDQVAKEVGVAVRNRSTVILLVTTGQLSDAARDFAREVVRSSPYTIVQLTGADVRQLARDETSIWDLLRREATQAYATRADAGGRAVPSAEEPR